MLMLVNLNNDVGCFQELNDSNSEAPFVFVRITENDKSDLETAIFCVTSLFKHFFVVFKRTTKMNEKFNITHYLLIQW